MGISGHWPLFPGREAEGPYLIGSDRKHRPQASLIFCQKERAAMALLKVTGIGRSPRWNLQKGTLLAWAEAGCWWGSLRPRTAPKRRAPSVPRPGPGPPP